jgi:hypothetical protein
MTDDQRFRSLTAEFQQTAREERRSTAAEIERLSVRAAELDAQAAVVRRELEQARRVLRRLDLVLGVEPQLDLDDATSTLHGERLARVATDLLSQRSPDQAVHYKQWYEWLLDQGYKIGGRDPLATFLVSVSRAPAVERVGSRTGRYRLRAA